MASFRFCSKRRGEADAFGSFPRSENIEIVTLVHVCRLVLVNQIFFSFTEKVSIEDSGTHADQGLTIRVSTLHVMDYHIT